MPRTRRAPPPRAFNLILPGKDRTVYATDALDLIESSGTDVVTMEPFHPFDRHLHRVRSSHTPRRIKAAELVAFVADAAQPTSAWEPVATPMPPVHGNRAQRERNTEIP